MVSIRWLVVVSVIRVVVLLVWVLLFWLGMTAGGPVGELFLLGAIFFFIVTIGFSFWVRSRVWQARLMRPTVALIDGVAVRQLRRVIFQRRLFLGLFGGIALYLILVSRGFVQQGAAFAFVLLIATAIASELLSRGTPSEPEHDQGDSQS